mmetsp:Transcript_20444/g.34257  ORF Transcript_20444/g.34257 Transcript_20444/m.34257 type:complete len:210 (+) Transcript_20444:329-958(+)|eukprot:CAMPEP_0198210334 /NCGR_PEP_ID=MMETSP1445-20131203/20041_1 /TAXON_ID=36898 /ORGANISM="Pyramimonas sp., Strain CCMP2087" /LENGTH=209 /DNA_ID=CAMNT_0043884371 /DNA_START=257 /DNA_END=886 /DNA_ORIENTATION=+
MAPKPEAAAAAAAPAPTAPPAEVAPVAEPEPVEKGGGANKAGEKPKASVNMNSAATAVLSLDRMMARMRLRYDNTIRQIKEDEHEIAYLDSEIELFQSRLNVVSTQLDGENSNLRTATLCQTWSTKTAIQAEADQAKLLREVQGKMRLLARNTYNGTPKAIAYHSPHGIMPAEVRPARLSKNTGPAGFSSGNKLKVGTSSIYRKAGGLE